MKYKSLILFLISSLFLINCNSNQVIDDSTDKNELFSSNSPFLNHPNPDRKTIEDKESGISLSVSSALTEINTKRNSETSNIPCIEYESSWKLSNSDAKTTGYELHLSVVTYEGKLPQIFTDLKSKNTDTEVLLRSEYLAKIKHLPKGQFKRDIYYDSIRKVEYLKLDGVNGLYWQLTKAQTDENFPRTEAEGMAVWQTYRYFDNKAQIIHITFIGRKEDFAEKSDSLEEEFKQILKSVKLI